jgi:3-deoxy-D-manno-octulosonate 8-phosphate phosphatase (KDO 8-P phosphatase)
MDRMVSAPMAALAARPLPVFELQARARRLKLVLTDCDGVLTDGGVYYSADGEALKRFSMRDGMGVERLRLAGIETAILTREVSAPVERRAAKLRLSHAFLGVADKRAHLEAIQAATGIGRAEMAYIGDDVNDLAILASIGDEGLTAAPADAMPDVLRVVHRACPSRGGHGAFRDFAEWILKLREDA